MEIGGLRKRRKRRRTSIEHDYDESGIRNIEPESCNNDGGPHDNVSIVGHHSICNESSQCLLSVENESESKSTQHMSINENVNETQRSSSYVLNKSRKIHLSHLDCRELSNSSIGAKALSKPFEVPKSNRDPNKYLQPRTRRKEKNRYEHGVKSPCCHENQVANNKSVCHKDIAECQDQSSQHDHGNSSQQFQKYHKPLEPSSSPFESSGFTKASSLLNSCQDPSKSNYEEDDSSFEGSNNRSSTFTLASNLLGLTDSQLEVGGFTSTKSVVNKLFQRTKSKIKRAKDSAGANQKSISNFFTQSKHQSTSPRKIKMEPKESEKDADMSDLYRSPSKMYSPIKKLSGCIYVSDSSPESSQNSSQESTRKHSLQDNAAVKKLFEGQKILASGQPLPKRRKQISTSQPSFTRSSNNSATTTETKSMTRKENHDEKLYKNTYGLVGEGSSSSFEDANRNTINYFEILPFDILELIFSQLPILDLCLNSNRVCLQWNEIISDGRFVPWKKRYHKLKAEQKEVLTEIYVIMANAGMTLPSNYLKGLIRYMRDFKPVTASNMAECLRRHPKFDWAVSLIKERVPECIENKEPNPWSLIATLVIISDSVLDIQNILTSLAVSQSQCTSVEVMECLYCIASLLYVFRLHSGADVWSGMHYRVFYALYLYENSSVSNHGMLQEAMSGNTSGQQTIVKYSRGETSVRLTHEQLRIIKHTPNPGDTIKIIAFAGTGKTTTLVRYTQMRPDKKFLLVVYNKSVCEHAVKQFPKNVKCKTGHALAFTYMGRKYASLKKLRNLKVYEISQVLNTRKGHNLYIQSKFVMETINNFCCSADDNITSAHVPDTRLDDSGNKIAIDHEAKMAYAEDAEYLWRRMKDFNDARVGMTHDGYLKMYQLSRPQLPEYDVILIDEAQDLTPAVIDILVNQNQAKILVGDPHQQIYSFRGAVNAMRQIPSSHTFYLTQSFRFGPEIAQVAASCLEVFKNVKNKTIVGHGNPVHIRGEKVGQVAIICRLNFTVFSEAVKKCCYASEQFKVAFVGGTDAFGFPMIHDIYVLMLSESDRKKGNHVIQNKLISRFSNLAELEKYATRVTDVELLGKIRIVKTFHNSIPMCLSKISSKCVRDLAQADYVFSTAHKAKGLEFSTVIVTDDFVHVQSSIDIRGVGFYQLAKIVHIPPDETNLLYVAVTRAKNALLLSPTLLKVLKDNGEKFEYPVSSKQLEKLGVPFKCFQTDSVFQPYSLTLRKMDVTLGENDVRNGGVYSPVILSEDFHRFAELLGDPNVKPKSKEARVGRAVFEHDEDSDDEDDNLIQIDL